MFKNMNKGLTLIEILITMAILALVLTMVYTVLMSTLNARDLIEEKTHTDKIASRLLFMLKRDIQAAYLYSLEGAYFSGKSSRIDFITNVDSFVANDDIKSDLCEVGYFLRNADEGCMKLLRREDFFIDNAPQQGGYAIKLYDRVASMKFKYIGLNGIKESWDSKSEKSLPIAVSVTLGLYTAPRNSNIDVIRKSCRYFTICIPILVSPMSPPKEKEKEKEKKEGENNENPK